jgi:hypothetical protein
MKGRNKERERGKTQFNEEREWRRVKLTQEHVLLVSDLSLDPAPPPFFLFPLAHLTP